MDEAGIHGFGTWRPETSSGEETSNLTHTGLESPATGPRAGVRPRETDGGGGKAGNQNNC